MWSRGAITQPFDTFRAEPLDPFGNGLRRRVELVGRVGLAQPALWSLPGTLKLRNLSFLGSDQMDNLLKDHT